MYGCPKDRFADHFGGQRADEILVRLHTADGYRVNAVAISRRMNRVDRPGITVVSHARDLAQLAFFEFRVGDY